MTVLYLFELFLKGVESLVIDFLNMSAFNLIFLILPVFLFKFILNFMKGDCS